MRKKLFSFCAMLFCLISSYAQTRTVTGTVTDDKGSPLNGVTVNAIATDRKVVATAVTNASGSFLIKVPQKIRGLQFSFVGFEEQIISVEGKNSITVKLSSTSKNLDEVVVVGYGMQKKKENTGSVSTIKGSEVAEKPVQSFEQALAGKATGVQITTPSGVLNTPPVFRIRGTNSISLSSYPLIVVDGVPTFTGDYSGTNAAANALASINPNDIESIDIAKDAAATAIYGSRAANGVVFITTKKGKAGKTKVSYDGWFGWAQVTGLPSMMNTSQYMSFKTSAVNNYLALATPGAATPITYATVTDASGKVVDTKWSDYVYRQAMSNSHNINVSGGNDNTTYYLSVGYTAQQGVIKKNDFNRLNALLNVDSRINNKVTIGGKLSYSNEQNYAATSSGSLSGEAFNTAGLGRLAVVLPPIISPYKNDGSYNTNGSAIGSSNIGVLSTISYFNPVVSLDLNRSNSENNHIQSSAYIQFKPIKSITLKSQYGIDYLFVSNDLFWSPVAGDGYSYNGYASAWQTNYKRWLWTNTASFDQKFGDHSVNVLVGNEQQRNTTLGFGINRQTLSDPAYNLIQAGWTTNNSTGQAYGENYLLSSFGRVNYNYKGKYFLSGNVRQDEYSGLGVKKGTFWGASIAWELSKEKFWQSMGIDKLFSSARLKGGVGKVGNINGIGDYSPFSTFGSGLYGGTATLGFASVGNNKLQWETSQQTSVGLAFGLLRDKVTGEITYYNNNIDNLILSVPQSPSAGLPSNILQNVGTMYNRGIELQLSSTIIDKKNFTWRSTFNYSYNTNMVTALASGLSNIQTPTAGLETANQTMPGYSIGYIWVVKTAGVDPQTGKRIFLNSAGTPVYYSYTVANQLPKLYNYSTTADGQTKYVSSTGGTTITQAADAVMYANAVPKSVGGWQNDFRFKNFELSALLTYQTGFYIYYGSNAGLHDQRWWNNATDMLTDAWAQSGNAGKKYARPVYGDNVSNGSAMPLDINVFKGDFVKLKSLTLSYNLPKSLLDKSKLSSVRLYVSGNNLAIITKYPGPDPEVSSNGNSTQAQGVDRNTAASARTFTIGLNVGF